MADANKVINTRPGENIGKGEGLVSGADDTGPAPGVDTQADQRSGETAAGSRNQKGRGGNPPEQKGDQKDQGGRREGDAA